MASRHSLLAYLLILLGTAFLARAHGPLDMTSRMTVYPERMEITCTVGLDAARKVLSQSGLSEQAIAKSLKALGPDAQIEQSPAMAERLFKLVQGSSIVPATRVVSRAEGMELVFILTFPRPGGGRLRVTAQAYSSIPDLRPGSLMVLADPPANLGGALLSTEKPDLTVTLPPAEPQKSS